MRVVAIHSLDIDLVVYDWANHIKAAAKIALLRLFLLSYSTDESFTINVLDSRPTLEQREAIAATAAGGGAVAQPKATWALGGAAERLRGPSCRQLRILR